MRLIVKILSIMMIYLSSGSLELFKDGGAREEGPANAIYYSGPLNLILPTWLLVTMLIAIYTLSRKRIKWSDFHIEFILIFAISIISCIWADFPLKTIQAIVLLTAVYLLTLIHYKYSTTKSIEKLISNTLLAMLLASLAGIFLLPKYGVAVGIHEGKWQGIFDHKNGLGNFASLCFCYFLGEAFSKWRINTLFKLIISIVLTLGSQSFTAIAILGAAIVVFVLLKIPPILRFAAKFKKFSISMVLAASCSIVIFSLTNSSLSILDKDSGFSGRSLIWAYVLNRSLEAPIFGHGINQLSATSKDNDATIYNNIGFVAGSSHNGFLETFFSLGIIGLLAALSILYRTLPNNARNDFSFAFLLLISIIITNSFEAKLISLNLYIVIAFYLLHKAKHSKHLSLKRLATYEITSSNLSQYATRPSNSDAGNRLHS